MQSISISGLLAVLFCLQALPQDRAAHRYLFLDPPIIEESHGVALTVNSPQRRETVILPDKPWEQLMISFFLTVRQEGDRLRMWYICRDAQYIPNLAYAESHDGIHWTKPNLGIIDYHGSRENNLVGIPALEGVVFTDPQAPAQERYEYVTNFGTEDGIVRFSSPDGLHWTRHDGRLLPFTSDTQNVTFWDERLKQYVLYLRGWDPASRRRKVVRVAVASLAGPIPISPSGKGMFPGSNKQRLPFVFDELPTVLKTDARDPSRADIYNIAAQPYPLDSSWYVGFPTFLRRSVESDTPQYRGSHRGPAEIQFVGSRDGISWQRYDRTAYVAPGGDGVNLEQMTFMGTGLIIRDNEIWQYGTTFRTEHGDVEGRKKKTDGSIVRYIQRIDGFVSVTSQDDEGMLRTAPVRVTGGKLLLNVNTGALGEIRVGLIGGDGKPIAGFSAENCDPLQANSLGAVVSWRGLSDLTKFEGRELRLQFHSRRTKLYSFRFE